MSTRTLTTTLPSDTLYVSGTVNGVSTTWTNTEGQTWETVAERSASDVYVVELVIINAFGTSSEAKFTLYYGLHLITDRVNADVQYVQNLANKIKGNTATEEELSEWNSASLKGAYNYTDFNRVGAAIKYLESRFLEYGYIVSVDPKTDWKENEVPTEKETLHYLEQVKILRKMIPLLLTTPAVPVDMDGFTFEEANSIEKILEDIDFLLTNIAASWVYSGEVYSGEV